MKAASTLDYRELARRRLPRFLFLGAAALTLAILLILSKPLMRVWRAEG